jgi:hypothetical protein
MGGDDYGSTIHYGDIEGREGYWPVEVATSSGRSSEWCGCLRSWRVRVRSALASSSFST